MRWTGVEGAVESPLFPNWERAPVAGLPRAQHFGGDDVATLCGFHWLCAAHHVGLADRVLDRHCTLVRVVPAHQLAACDYPNCATAAHQVREGHGSGKSQFTLLTLNPQHCV